MKIAALSVGGRRELEWRGQTVQTSIFKAPVAGRLHVARLNIEGDKQSDLTVHGGPLKAVYAYPAEHYPYWREQLPDSEFPWGAFGENMTTEGMLEDDVCIGDRYRVGSVELVVTQPRMPCYKLAIRFGRADMVKRFLRSRTSGFYFSVAKEGEMGAGDVIERIARDGRNLAIIDVVTLYFADEPDWTLLERAGAHPSLPAMWRDYFRKLLSEREM